MNHKFIAIEGVIGVGKTTLTRLLKPYFQATVLLEVFEENPFLADFYTDRQRYAFQTQLFFLLSRYQQQLQTVPQALSEGHVLSDYTFAKDELFAWLNLKDDELAMYGRVHSALGDKIRRPDLLVYLRADHEAVMQRIAQRDRPYERDMDPEYIRQLSSAYEAWIASLVDIPILILDMTKRDVLINSKDLDFVYEQITQKLASQAPTAHIKYPLSSTSDLLAPDNNTLSNYQALWREINPNGATNADPLGHYLHLTSKTGEIGLTISQEWDITKSAVETKNAISQKMIANQLTDLLSNLFMLANDFDIDLAEAYKKKITQSFKR